MASLLTRNSRIEKSTTTRLFCPHSSWKLFSFSNGEWHIANRATEGYNHLVTGSERGLVNNMTRKLAQKVVFLQTHRVMIFLTLHHICSFIAILKRSVVSRIICLISGRPIFHVSRVRNAGSCFMFNRLGVHVVGPGLEEKRPTSTHVPSCVSRPRQTG